MHASHSHVCIIPICLLRVRLGRPVDKYTVIVSRQHKVDDGSHEQGGAVSELHVCRRAPLAEVVVDRRFGADPHFVAVHGREPREHHTILRDEIRVNESSM